MSTAAGPPESWAILRCSHAHATLWPSDLLPYPDKCPQWIGGTSLCSAPLSDSNLIATTKPSRTDGPIVGSRAKVLAALEG